MAGTTEAETARPGISPGVFNGVDEKGTGGGNLDRVVECPEHGSQPATFVCQTGAAPVGTAPSSLLPLCCAAGLAAGDLERRPDRLVSHDADPARIEAAHLAVVGDIREQHRMVAYR